MVREGRYMVSPVDPNGTPHPFLSVLFDVRSFVDGVGPGLGIQSLSHKGNIRASSGVGGV